MKITIATGIYPPEIGGPSEYARQLYETMQIQNQDVSVLTYGDIKSFPTGIRHFLFFCKMCLDAYDTDYVIALDTFSTALPSVLFAKLFRKKIVIRVAGDFLWESFVERTGEDILLSKFYLENRKFTIKEKIIFKVTRFVLAHADKVVFSTEWQKSIMEKPYGIPPGNTTIIENFFPIPSDSRVPERKIFLSPSREIKIKNKKVLFQAFSRVSLDYPEIVLDTKVVSREVLLEKISTAYAVLVPSLSDVSPNLVIDAISYDVPVLVTQDTGMLHRLSDIAVVVDPLSVSDVARGIESLLNPDIYSTYKRKILQNTYSHSWNEIAQEFLDLYSRI